MTIAHRVLASLLALALASPAQETRPLRVVELRGTPYERGLLHGQTLRAEIGTLVELWRHDIAKQSGVDADAFVTRFLAETQFEAAVRRVTPGLLDEVRGIAAGAEQPFATMFAYQLVDEVWAQTPVLFTPKCSTIGLDRDGDRPALVAQNLDLPRWMHAYPTVLRIHEPDRALEQLVVTLPGLIGANGLSSRRIAVGVNTVLQNQPCRDGLPVAFVVRGLLAQEDHVAALRFLHQVKHASGQAYTLGGPDRAPCFEASANKVVPFVAFAGAPRTFHTNHPLVNDEWADRFAAAARDRGKEPRELLRCDRFDELVRRLGSAAERVGVEQVVQALSSRTPAPVCNPMTYVCTVMLLGEEPELRIAPGPPDVTPFQTLRFAVTGSGGR